MVAVEIRLLNSPKNLISVFYRSPSLDPEIFVENFRLFPSQINNFGLKQVLTLGDFNFPQINWYTLSSDVNNIAFALFCELLSDHSLDQLNLSPSREANNNVLDLILTSISELFQNLTLKGPCCDTFLTDHRLLNFDFRVKAVKTIDRSALFTPLKMQILKSFV